MDNFNKSSTKAIGFSVKNKFDDGGGGRV